MVPVTREIACALDLGPERLLVEVVAGDEAGQGVALGLGPEQRPQNAMHQPPGPAINQR